jgi:phage recombination protein Bet
MKKKKMNVLVNQGGHMNEVIIQENKNQDLDSKTDLIKRLYCKGASNDEFELFLHACKRTGLDPFMKQIYAIKRAGQLTIQTGIDGLRLVAERTGNYSPGRESTFCQDEKGYLISATSYIKKRTSDGTWHEVSATAYLDEYNAKQGLWGKMPRAMLSKCAEALALRKAFPAEMSGVYTKDEMEQADQIPMAQTEDIPDMPLTEEQCAQIDLIFTSIKRKEFHQEKISKLLDATDIYDISQKDYQRIIDYLNHVILIQKKQEIA